MQNSYGSPFRGEPTYDDLLAYDARMKQQQREQQWMAQNPQAVNEMQGLEQPWLDPVDTLTGGLSSLPRGLASAGIDMALSLAQRMGGDDLAKGIQLSIEYDPQPPFDAGSPEAAGPRLVENVRRALEAKRAGST